MPVQCDAAALHVPVVNCTAWQQLVCANDEPWRATGAPNSVVEVEVPAGIVAVHRHKDACRRIGRSTAARTRTALVAQERDFGLRTGQRCGTRGNGKRNVRALQV